MLLAGRFLLRLVIPIWGFFAGFAFGAGIVAEFADEHFLGTVLSGVLGLVFAVIFAVLAGGEDPTLRMIVGGAMVVTAMLVVELMPRRKVEAEVPHIAV